MKKTAISLFSLFAVLLVAASFSSRARSNTKTDMSRNIRIFTEIYKELQTNYVDTLDATKTMRTAIDALLGQIDPYTEYYSDEQQDEITSVSSGEYSGIGSVIQKRDSVIALSDPRWNSPARKAGVRHGDILLEIDGQKVDRDFTVEMASARLKGQPGTVVSIKVRRPWLPAGSDSILSFDITRGTINIDPVPYYGNIGDGIGYIALTTFNDKTAAEFRKALAALKADPEVTSLLIDLRNNGGGLLESAVQVASNFVPKGTEIVSTRGRDPRNVKTYKTTTAPVDTRMPVAVLINEGTASAAEILSGSLQDLDRAVIIGQRSYGKGLVQNVRPVSFNGIVKVTTARYYIPSGRLIQAIDYSHRNPDGTVARIPDSLTNVYHTRVGRIVRDGGGITPDVKVELPDANRLLYNVVAYQWDYDFANRYANRLSQTPDPATWEVTDTIFAEFKGFIDPARFKYDRATEEGIKYMRKAAEAEGYMNDSVSSQLDLLERLMTHDLQRDLDFNRVELVRLLDAEMGKRWFSDAELLRRSLKSDEAVTEARAVLTSPERYSSLLAPPADEK